MPSRKQRRRREKDRRHEYEYVYVDEAGREVEAAEAEAAAARPEEPKGRPAAARGGRAGRQVPPPSWRRVGKRAAIFAPLLFLLIQFTTKKASIAQSLFTAALLVAFFVPFSYLMDSLMYRWYRKRTGGGQPERRR